MVKRITLIIGILCTLSCQAFAQGNYILQKDTLRSGIRMWQPAGPQKYHQIKCEISKRKIIEYTPDEVVEYRYDGMVYVSLPSPVTGENKRVFLRRVIRNDSVAVYQYGNQDGEHLYFQQGNSEMVLIEHWYNPYAEYVYSTYATRKDLPINHYPIKPTTRSILFADKLIRTENSNLLTRFRYGLWLGGGLAIYPKGEMDKNAQSATLLGGAFMNIPLYGPTVSLQTQLLYMQEAYSLSSTDGGIFRDRVLNRQSIALPLMPRFTANWLTGKWIPYLQAGPSLHYTLSGEMEERTTVLTNDHFVNTHTITTDLPQFYGGFAVGLGLEYKLNRRHALFVDLNFLHTFDDNAYNMVYAALSFNF